MFSSMPSHAGPVAAQDRHDTLVAYMARAKTAFDDLRDVASQLAALMVLAGSGSRAATLDHPMLCVAAERWRAANDSVRSLRPPTGSHGHHYHLVMAAQRLGEDLGAMGAAGTLVGRLGTPLHLLKAAWQEIVFVSRALPGFALVDFDQCCCAMHAKLRRGPRFTA